MSTLLETVNESMASVAAGARRSLVQVRDGRGGAGAGVVLHPQGLILTSAHVVRSRRTEIQLADGRQLRGRLLAHSAERDLALLEVEADDLPSIELGDSDNLAPGSWVLAMGHPWGVPGGATAGVVIGVGTQLPEVPSLGPESSWIAVSAHLRPGHSGGPLVDHGGRLVGVNTMMAGPDVGLAVPVDVAKRYLHQALGSQLPPLRVPAMV